MNWKHVASEGKLERLNCSILGYDRNFAMFSSVFDVFMTGDKSGGWRPGNDFKFSLKALFGLVGIGIAYRKKRRETQDTRKYKNTRADVCVLSACCLFRAILFYMQDCKLLCRASLLILFFSQYVFDAAIAASDWWRKRWNLVVSSTSKRPAIIGMLEIITNW